MRDLGARAVELIQGASVRGYASKMTTPPDQWAAMTDDNATLLVEFGVADEEELNILTSRMAAQLNDQDFLFPLEMSTDSDFIALSWHVRGNMNADLAAQRPAGSPIIQEDTCFPPARLAEAVKDLSALLKRYEYPHLVAGHAMFGNMHFAVTPDLGDDDEVERYGRFMDEFVELVVDKYDGSLKAEHGTGINFAPFVPIQWGEHITDLMWQVRKLADPNEVLGTDILLTKDPRRHLKRFRTEPQVENTIDPCIECGLCEPACPSRHLSATPRQRITLRREMARHDSDSPQ